MAPNSRRPSIDLNNPRLLVRDYARSWKFYTKTLGLAPVSGDGTPPYGEVGSSQRFVGLFLRGAMDDLIGPAGALSDAPDRFSLVFEVPDVDRTLARLERADVSIEIGATDRPLWGLRTIHLRDPDGNLVEIYSRLPAVRRGPARTRPVR
ncbi:MAG: VOC family protein [Candidatus Lutacidiplasmatales archaeon]